MAKHGGEYPESATDQRVREHYIKTGRTWDGGSKPPNVLEPVKPKPKKEEVKKEK